MAYKKLLRPGGSRNTLSDTLASFDQSGQQPRDPNTVRLPPVVEQAGRLVSDDNPPPLSPPPSAQPTTPRPFAQGVHILPIGKQQFGAPAQEQIGTFGGIPLILETAARPDLARKGTPVVAPTPSPTPMPTPTPTPTPTPAPTQQEPGFLDRLGGFIRRALDVQRPTGGQTYTPPSEAPVTTGPYSPEYLRNPKAFEARRARESARLAQTPPQVYSPEYMANPQEFEASRQRTAAMMSQVPPQMLSPEAMAQWTPAQGMTTPGASRAATRQQPSPAGSQGARPPLSQPQPAAPEPPMQRYAFNQMPAATTAPQAGSSPIAPAQLLPSQASPAAQMSLSGAPGIGVTGVSQGQQAMERYATARLGDQMRKLQPGQRMSSIDLAREQYISEGARPTLDVKQLGAVMDQARATAYNPNLHATPGRGVSAPMHQALSAMARQGQYNQIVQNADTPIVAKQRRGFGEILKTAGVGALQGLAAGGLGGAIGGALTGGIAQAVSPEAGRRLRFETLERPELERARQQQIAEAQQERQERLTQAQIGNLESQARERASESEFRQREQERRDKYVTLGAGEALYERDPQTGRLVPRALNPRLYAERGGGQEEAIAQDRMMQSAYEEAQNVEKLRADVVRFGNDIVDQAKGSPEYKGAMQRYQAAVALARQRFPGVINFEPVTDQYGNTQYNLSMVDPSRRAAILSQDEQKAAAPKSGSGATPKRPSSSIEPRPKSKLMSLLD